MPSINPGVYKAIFSVRKAYMFDIGGFLMRFYTYMMNIGTISMLTLAGYSFLIAGLTSSIIAIATFFIAPRVSKLIDERGQSRIVPPATIITLCGLVVMLINVSFNGPFWVLFVAAVLMGCAPNAQALVRARWTFLIRSGKLGKKAPELRTMFSYEGIIDDVGFMFGPSLSVTFAASIAPIAGLLIGGIAFAVGVTLLLTSRSTEPEAGCVAADNYALNDGDTPENTDGQTSEPDQASASEQAHDADDTARARIQTRNRENHTSARRRAIILASPIVCVLFFLMLFLGGFLGTFDTATIALAEDAQDPNLASIILVLSACMSTIMGFIFGMLHLRVSQHIQLVVCAVLIGCSYSTMFFIDSVPMLFVVAIVSAMFYAPFLITVNATCECSVPNGRITEALTWVNAGITCGMAFGPTIAGLIIDEMGTLASFKFGAILALAIPVIALLCFRLLKRHIPSTH